MDTRNLIAYYVLECRNQGHFLPYEDYEVIDIWLEEAKDPEDLLLILSDILPNHLNKKGKFSRPPGLKPIKDKVLKRLKEKKSRQIK